MCWASCQCATPTTTSCTLWAGACYSVACACAGRGADALSPATTSPRLACSDAEGKAVGTRSKFGHLAKGDAKEARGTLLDMVDFGLLAPEVASQAVMDFRRELCSQQE